MAGRRPGQARATRRVTTSRAGSEPASSGCGLFAPGSPPYNPRTDLELTPGTRLGPYEIVSALGKGGMGEVYRATDTNLKRQVALKVLPAALTFDAHRLARFHREAELLAALSHPNIAAIFGLEQSGGVPALVMELVEGEDLARTIARGAMPMHEALAIAKQIAEALEAAHEQGIIHRDLKPGNIKLRADGTVKVLDFGLAKAMDPLTSTEADATIPGTILGTSAYMPPEQAKGKPVGRRADVWALGAILYEMLTGQRAFKGEDSTDTLAAVVSKEPDWTALPPDTPSVVRTVLRRCLARETRQRLDSAAAVRLEIEDALSAVPRGSASPAGIPTAHSRAAWAIAVVAMLALGAAVLAWAPWRPIPTPPETRTDIVTPATDDPASFALSPDGRQIVFAASGDGTLRLWLRSLGTTTARPLVGTEGGRNPFWAPDSRSIGFFTDSALKQLDLGAGGPQTVAPASSGAGGTWTADGHIVFAPSPSSSLLRVPAAGGPAAPVTTFGPQQNRPSLAVPRCPMASTSCSMREARQTRPASIWARSTEATPGRLTAAESAGVYHPAGWLLWMRAGTLVAQQFGLALGTLTGGPVTVADDVAIDTSERTAVSVAATGLVAYRTGAASQRQLAWFDRSGKALGTGPASRTRRGAAPVCHPTASV